jgi:predicted RND superfamily exporter protein
LFRGFTVVVVVALAPATGVFWAIGFLRYLGWENNPFSEVILPVLLSLVGFADGVHMMVYIRSCLSQGQSPREACRNALATVGVACSITTITTAIGMGSLSFSNHEIVREFAWSCVMGTTTILASVLLVIPLACCTPSGKRLERGAERGLIDRYIQQIGVPVKFMMRRPKLVAYFAIALMIVFATTALMLRPDDRLSNELPSGSPEQQMMSHLDSALGGLQQCTININWKGKELEPITIATMIHEIDTVLDQEKLVGHPLSIVRILKALPGYDTAVNKMPMVEVLPPPLKLALYDPDQHIAKITFRVQDLGTAKYRPIFQRIESSITAIRGKNPGVEIALEGGPIRRWKNLYQIVSDLAMSLGTASIEILIVMGIAFRSLRLGLIAIIPNMVPLAAAGTFMVVADWPLDVVSVCAFTICLGIAVDDTIHFLSRYREELHQQPNRTLALQQAFLGVGTGMIMTTLVLVAGFGSVLISETRDHRVFASLGIITLLSALLCDLFLLPSLLAHFDKSRNTDLSK